MNTNAKVISKTIRYGNQHWRLNADKTWSILCFGVTPYKLTPHYIWINISIDRVPEEVKKEAK